MLITDEALVKENSLLPGKLRLDNSEQIKNCLGNKTSADGEREEIGRREGRKKGGREGGRRNGGEQKERTESRGDERMEGRGKEGEEGEKVEWQEGTKNAQKIMKHTKPQHHCLTIIFFIIINTFH